MAISPTLKKAYWSLAAAGALYFVFITILLNGWTQRQALYLGWVNTKRWHDPRTPEQFGYLKNQVRPFHITTPDNIQLHGWHVLPLALYAKHEDALLQDPNHPSQSSESSTAFNLLGNDPNSRLVISFHGNAGTIAQGWRTDGYRALSAGLPSTIHVLTIDYRGFGLSTGSPTERGLIADGIALVEHALRTLGIPADRIVIQGHSLGTAVAVAVAEHFSLNEGVEFRGLVLVSAFEDIPTLMLTYAIGGVVPILSPLRPYPFLQRWFAGGIQETWRTGERLDGLVRGSRGCRVFLVHARNDFNIPWSHGENLFRVAVNATTERGIGVKEIDAVKWRTDFGRGGWRDEWKAEAREGGIKYVRLDVVPHGGHNRIVTYPVVSKAIVDAFDLVE